MAKRLKLIVMALALAGGALWLHGQSADGPAIDRVADPIPFPPIPTPPPPLPSPSPRPPFPFPPGGPVSTLHQAALLAFLGGLEEQGSDLTQQGILLIGPSGQQLAAYNPQQILSAATHLAVAAAALDRWGPNHHFQTRLYASSPVENGTLQGSLWVDITGAPSLTQAELSQLGQQLRTLGIDHVAGDILVRGLPGEQDPSLTGSLLLGGLNLSASGSVQPIWDLPAAARLLTGIRSAPLATLVRQMLAQGDDAIAQMLMAGLGGPLVVESSLMVDSEALGLTSGLDTNNLTSPKAVANLLDMLLLRAPEAGLKQQGANRLPIGTLAQAGLVHGFETLIGRMPNGVRFALFNQGADANAVRAWQARFLRDAALLPIPDVQP